ncbi:MAG TPA: alpha/beta hydrolase [Burkholderiaceae bacterium]|nr:alpha/beta hydrolase [Burkholderiaceae bacterium]
MNASTQVLRIPGPAGAIDTALDAPAGAPAGLAVVAHPHPLFGGTRDNKVVQTLARAFVALGYLTLRPNFRGIGDSEGSHDEGRGETDDLLAVVRAGSGLPALAALPHPLAPVLAGFSFGSFVQSRVAQALRAAGEPVGRMVLVGTAVKRFDVRPVPDDTLLIHGELDETVPLASVLEWARDGGAPVVVIPGADHFFHRRLTTIKRIVLQAWGRHDESGGAGE